MANAKGLQPLHRILPLGKDLMPSDGKVAFDRVPSSSCSTCCMSCMISIPIVSNTKLTCMIQNGTIIKIQLYQTSTPILLAEIRKPLNLPLMSKDVVPERKNLELREW